MPASGRTLAWSRAALYRVAWEAILPIGHRLRPRGLMMTTAMDGLIVIDDGGVARVTGSRSRVIDIVLDKTAYGLSPEQTREQHPHLSMSQIHAALAYYYAHQAATDAEIERQFREAEAMRSAAEASPSPLRTKLREAKRLREAGQVP